MIKDELAAGIREESAQLPGLTETISAVTVALRFPNPLVRELLEAGASASR